MFSCVTEAKWLKMLMKIFVPNEKEMARGWTTEYWEAS
jgi:hypothetical protein